MILLIKKPGNPDEIILENENVSREAQIKAAELTVLIHNRDNQSDLWTVEKIDEE